jgi:transcriptional regulator with XRE-family HTH domain
MESAGRSAGKSALSHCCRIQAVKPDGISRFSKPKLPNKAFQLNEVKIMDMKINQELLRREREQRAWTQSHLAEVADLSLRTVQRIERAGDASMESASALAAALDLDLAVLLEIPADQNQTAKSRRYTLWGILGMIGSAVVALGWWSSATAEQVMVSLSIQTPDNVYSNMQLLNKIGKESELELDDQFRMVFTTTRQGEHLLLSANIFQLVDGEYKVFANPAISLLVDYPDGQRVNLHFVADF